MDRKKLSEFWVQSSSATFGTVVGIILTFGTTLCLQRCEQKQMERKESLWVIYDIDGFCEQLSDDLENFEEVDSLNDVVWNNLDNLDKIPKDTLNRFVYNLTSLAFAGYDTTVDKIFGMNIDTWKNIDNNKFLSNAGQCLALKNRVIELYDKIVEEERRIQKTLITNLKYSHAPAKKIREYVKRILDSDDVRSFIGIHKYYVSIMRLSLTLLKEYNATNKKIMHVTDEELMEIFDEGDQKD